MSIYEYMSIIYEYYIKKYKHATFQSILKKIIINQLNYIIS